MFLSTNVCYNTFKRILKDSEVIKLNRNSRNLTSDLSSDLVAYDGKSNCCQTAFLIKNNFYDMALLTTFGRLGGDSQ